MTLHGEWRDELPEIVRQYGSSGLTKLLETELRQATYMTRGEDLPIILNLLGIELVAEVTEFLRTEGFTVSFCPLGKIEITDGSQTVEGVDLSHAIMELIDQELSSNLAAKIGHYLCGRHAIDDFKSRHDYLFD